MNICSVVVHAHPQNARSVRSELEDLEGTEVHGGMEEGKLIVTVEQASDSEMADTVGRFTDIEGVLSASMIYHHYEELEQGVVE